MIPESAEQNRPGRRRELVVLLTVWIVLAAATFSLARPNFSEPGLYYDEAVFAGLAKDFLSGEQRTDRHMPNNKTVMVFGRRFPVFVQPYLGALKSWMYMPSFAVAGATVAVLRTTTFCWAAIALLLFMIATRKWLGLRTALVAGVLLGTDPNYFFLSAWDWGSVIPSFLCRFGCFYLIARWLRERRMSQAFWASFLAGLGFFNKIDFALLLIGSASALAVVRWPFVRRTVTTRPSIIVWTCLGFVCGGGLMFFNVPGLLGYGFSDQAKRAPHEFAEKFHTLLSLYDGSHFYRLMKFGGSFAKMFEDPFGIGAFIALAVVVVSAAWLFFRRTETENLRPTSLTLFLACAFTTVGVFLLTGATRIHHAILVYPLPQLLVSAAIVSVWNMTTSLGRAGNLGRALLVLLVAAIVTGRVTMILRTQTMIRETGGRGLWTDSFTSFCREHSHRTDLTIVSLDWGFNEQLAFLTNGPRLSDPSWALGASIPQGTPLTRNPGSIYLLHPPEYAVAPESLPYLFSLQKNNEGAEIQPYRDKQGGIAFYAIHFPPR